MRLNKVKKRLTTFCCITVASIFLLACSDEGKKQPQAAQARLVKTFVVGSSITKLTRTYPGKVLAGERVNLAFQVQGQLIGLPVKKGERVTQGQVLANLDARDYQHKYNAEQANLHKAKLQYQRAKELLVTKHIAKARYDILEADYRVALAQTATAKKALDDAQLKAPFSGVVADTFVENFEDVKAKQKILSLQDISSIDITVDLPEQLAMRAKYRQSLKLAELPNVIVTFNALPGREFKVRGKEFATEADPMTQTYQVTLTMVAPKDVNIFSGMTATVVVKNPRDANKQALFIPVNAVLIDNQGKHYVWVVNKKTMIAKKQVVSIGKMTAGKVEITSGLVVKQEVVVAGGTQIQQGMKLRILTGKIGKE